MSHKYIILILSFTMLCFSTCDKEEIEEYSKLSFCPRECTEMITLPQQITRKTESSNGSSVTYNKIEAIGDDGVEADKYILWLMTGGDDLNNEVKNRVKNGEDKMLYEAMIYSPQLNRENKFKYKSLSIPRLEKQLENDYRNESSIRSETRSSSGKDEMNLIFWTYRVTGIKNFNIIALSPLFGQPAKTSLNRFFKIHSFKPRQIISHRTKNLLWGYSDNNNVEDLRQWLAMEPMAPHEVTFRFRSIPREVPTEVKFVTVLETTDGKILRDTVQARLK